MDEKNEKNLKDLFAKFLDAEQARQAAQDVLKGEQIMRDNPTPEPADKLVGDIKTNIARDLFRNKAKTFRKRACIAAAVAAVIIIAAAISLQLFEKENGKSKRVIVASTTSVSRAIWESDDITVDDADFVIFTAEIEQIEDKLLSLQLGEDSGNGSTKITELELEISEINSEFWKG